MIARPLHRTSRALLVLALLAGGCTGAVEPPASDMGSASPRAETARPATGTPGDTLAPTGSWRPTPAASNSGAGRTPEGYVRVAIPPAAVHTVGMPPGFRFHRLDSDGPLVAVDEMPPSETELPRTIRVVDLQAGSIATLPAAPEGFRAWFPAISGQRVAWIELRGPGPNVPGPLEWRIVVSDATGIAARVVASGVQRRSGTRFGASWPVMDLDGDRLAYAAEDPERPPDGWIVRVVSLASGAVARTIRTSLPVYDLALSGADLAWTVGRIEPEVGFTYDTRLLVLRSSDAEPFELARDAYEIAFQDGRLAWSQDAHTRVTGAPEGTRIWTAVAATPVPEVASPVPGRGTEQYQAWPATGDGFVTWDSSRLSLEDASVNGDRFCVWDPRDRVAYELDPTPGAVLGGAGGGWLVWMNERDGAPGVFGVPIAESGLP